MSPANNPGETPKRETPTATKTCQSALRDAGVDEELLAIKLKSLLDAKKQRWNHKNKSWEEFDDCATQLEAIKEILKLFGGYPSDIEETKSFIFINDSMPPRRPRTESGKRSEHCQAGVQGTVPEALSGRIAQSPDPTKARY